jgi:hypothetical protein
MAANVPPPVALTKGSGSFYARGKSHYQEGELVISDDDEGEIREVIASSAPSGPAPSEMRFFDQPPPSDHDMRFFDQPPAYSSPGLDDKYGEEDDGIIIELTHDDDSEGEEMLRAEFGSLADIVASDVWRNHYELP